MEVFSGLLGFFGPPLGAQGPPKNHFGVQKGRANIEGEQFFFAIVHLGTIFNDLDPFGTDFGASGEQFWSSGQRFLEVRDVNESLVPSC